MAGFHCSTIYLLTLKNSHIGYCNKANGIYNEAEIGRRNGRLVELINIQSTHNVEAVIQATEQDTDRSKQWQHINFDSTANLCMAYLPPECIGKSSVQAWKSLKIILKISRLFFTCSNKGKRFPTAFCFDVRGL